MRDRDHDCEAEGCTADGNLCGIDDEPGNPTLAAAKQLVTKLSKGETGNKKRRKYNVEKFLSHPQFCKLGNVVDKKAFDENFERVFGKAPPKVDYGQRDGYVVRKHTGRHEGTIVGDSDDNDLPTPEERAATRKKRIERLRRARGKA